MDFSEEYIVMCEASTELQGMLKEREITNKDFMAKKTSEDEEETKPSGADFNGDMSDYIWLPRQDQLQEMLMGAKLEGDTDPTQDNIGEMVEDLHETIVKNPVMISFEQMWLCLFMKHFYMKTWNIIEKKWEER